MITITEELIREAARRLGEAAGEDATVILFGSQARGDADRFSDVDFLVIEPEVPRKFAEGVRLSRALRPLRIPADVVVISRAEAAAPDLAPDAIYEALQQGRVVYPPDA